MCTTFIKYTNEYKTLSLYSIRLIYKVQSNWTVLHIIINMVYDLLYST